MSLPTDFHHEVADRVEPPGFDVVLDRARAGRRRRRTTLAAGLAAACVVGGLATWGSGWRAADGPEPAGPTPSRVPTELTGQVDERLPDDVRDLLEAEELHPWAVAGSGGGVAVLWQGCPGDSARDNPCEFALVTRLGDRVGGVVLEGGAPTITEVPGGWLVRDDSGLTRVSADGAREPVHDARPGDDDVVAGDTAVQTSDGTRLLRGDDLVAVPVPPAPDSDVLSAYVTPDGRLVAAASTGAGVRVWTTDDGRTWGTQMSARSTTAPISSAVVAGHGDHVAVAFLGDDRDGTIPLVEVQYSHDAGATWEWARGLDVEGADGIRDLSSVAVSDEGSTYLTTGSHGLVRIDADGNAVASRLSSHDSSAFLVAHRVCLVAEAGRVDQLRCSPDDGTTWVPQPLPGFG